MAHQLPFGTLAQSPAENVGKTCRQAASSLGRHLADLHEINQQQVVAEELLDRWEGVVTKSRWGMGHSNVRSPFARGSWQVGG